MLFPRSRRRAALVVAPFLLAASVLPARAHQRSQPPPVEIKVLSNRADLVSGGDALVEVVLPPGAPAAMVDVDGRDVTAAFARRADGRFVGLVTGLAVGPNSSAS